MSVDYDGRRFRPVINAPNGEVTGETVFEYRQVGEVVWATYTGGEVTCGVLVATVNASGELDMRYSHVNRRGELMTGICHSRPELLADGRIRLHERWHWTSGDHSQGESVIEQV